MTETDRSIDGVAKTISEVLEKKKYSIDYYQREYKWEAKQLEELVQDLTTKFLDIYEPSHRHADVANYQGYYLGSIIISQKQGHPFIVDGQQRLSSLTLLLTYLRRLQTGRDVRVDIDQLIFSEKFGQRSFNLDVPDRNRCMQALFEDGEYDPLPDEPESVHTLVARYRELDHIFPEELKGDVLVFFIDWLQHRVQLVQITAYADDDAYAIFETMNDRGLKPTPADMLKGYLLANMEEGGTRTSANELRRHRMRQLDEQADDAGSDFLKTWLRSQYALRIRERSKGAEAQDWDRIGTQFHRWLRSAHEQLGLNRPDDFFAFVDRDFRFYSQQYERLLVASNSPVGPSDPLRFVGYNADLGFTLQYQLLLAPLTPDDDPAVIDRKFEIVGRFVDILLAWRIWNYRSTAYSTMQYAMFTVMRDIRTARVEELAQRLYDYLRREKQNFGTQDELGLHQQNRWPLHVILARLTDYVTTSSGQVSNYLELTNNAGIKYEVEHIWANHFERHTDEFAHEADFERHRNRIGDLLLLPKPFNASYGDEPYDRKRPRYFSQNLLAASLDPQTYDKNPGFLGFVREMGLPFHSHEVFKAHDIVERGELYRDLAERVWDPDELLRAGGRD